MPIDAQRMPLNSVHVWASRNLDRSQFLRNGSWNTLDQTGGIQFLHCTLLRGQEEGNQHTVSLFLIPFYIRHNRQVLLNKNRQVSLYKKWHLSVPYLYERCLLILRANTGTKQQPSSLLSEDDYLRLFIITPGCNHSRDCIFITTKGSYRRFLYRTGSWFKFWTKMLFCWFVSKWNVET